MEMQSRPIFNKSTRFEDMRRAEDEITPYRRPPMKKYLVVIVGAASYCILMICILFLLLVCSIDLLKNPGLMLETGISIWMFSRGKS